MARLRPALGNAAYAAYFGMAVAAVGAAGTAVVIAAGSVVAAALRAAAAGLGPGPLIAAAAAGWVVVAGVAMATETGDPALEMELDLGVNEIARKNIGVGMCIGGLAGIAMSITFAPLTILATIALVGGGTAGVLSLIRG